MGTALAPATIDVIDLLIDQHEEIREAVARLAAAPSASRGDALRALAELIEAHEDMEARLLHPLAQRLPDGDALAHALVVEENRADELLGQLLAAGPDDRRFSALFAEFRGVILGHLVREERDEFRQLRTRIPAQELVDLADRAGENRIWL